jgi:hypothetical protein
MPALVGEHPRNPSGEAKTRKAGKQKLNLGLLLIEAFRISISFCQPSRDLMNSAMRSTEPACSALGALAGQV